MKQFEGFKSEASSAAYPMLPEGPYVAVIKAVKIDGQEPDQTLVIRVDVSEGEHAKYFTNRYEHDKAAGGQYEVKYKGDYRLRIPNPRNTKALYPETDRRRFNDAIFRVEQSNPGYTWDWDENKLVGKTVGINMQAGEYNGAPYTTIGRFETANDVRNGIVKAMKPRKPRGEVASAPASEPAFTQVDNVDIPF